MRRATFGDGDDELAFVLGWGNRPEHDGVSWLVGHLIDAGYRVTAFELPRTITDFETEYVRPVAEALAGLGEYRLLSHSTGGLVVRHLDDDAVTRTYLSPWWGFHPDLETPLVRLATRIPLAWAVLPAGFTREELGGLAGDERVADAPDRAAPTFLREARRAQRDCPPFDDADAVFYCPDDPVVGVDTIEADVPPANRVAYDGGHELFNSRCRDEYRDALLAAVAGGAAALSDC